MEIRQSKPYRRFVWLLRVMIVDQLAAFVVVVSVVVGWFSFDAGRSLFAIALVVMAACVIGVAMQLPALASVTLTSRTLQSEFLELVRSAHFIRLAFRDTASFRPSALVPASVPGCLSAPGNSEADVAEDRELMEIRLSKPYRRSIWFFRRAIVAWLASLGVVSSVAIGWLNFTAGRGLFTVAVVIGPRAFSEALHRSLMSWHLPGSTRKLQADFRTWYGRRG